MKRIWPWTGMTLRDMAIGLCMCVFVAVLIAWSIFYPDWWERENYGFGPEWNCSTSSPGQISSLKCIKK
jgi:hypothetical protein